MPIPMPPPPAPYVAPDLRPIAARPSARLTFFPHDPQRTQELGLVAGFWIAADGAPLELRFHRRADGSVWGEQAAYADGDRHDGVASASAAAHVDVLSKRAVGGIGRLRGLARFTIRSSTGAALRTWRVDQCGTPGTVSRLDQPESPSSPTYRTSWDDCSDFGDGDGSYQLGAVVGLDRGWAMPVDTTVGSIAALPAGRYSLELDVDPIGELQDANPSNDVESVPVTVRVSLARGSDDGFEADDPVRRRAPGRTASTTTKQEPEWYATRLRMVESIVASRARADGAADVQLAPPADVELPNLRSAPSYEIHTSSIGRGVRRRDLLRFGALTWNAGPGPLEVEAFREAGTILHAFQVFYRDDRRVERQARGTLVWHAAPGHDHFHFTAFSRYRLTSLDGTVIREGGKHSWCIVDTDLVDATVPGAMVAPTVTPDATSGDCGSNPGALWARLSLSVGFGDFYGPDIAGQSFDITAVPNGTYRVSLEANPLRVIAESDYADNVSTRTVVLGGTRGARTVIVRPLPTIDERSFGF
jgi:hypothetical protein